MHTKRLHSVLADHPGWFPVQQPCPWGQSSLHSLPSNWINGGSRMEGAKKRNRSLDRPSELRGRTNSALDCTRLQLTCSEEQVPTGAQTDE